MNVPPYGFRVVGGKAGERRPIDWWAAFAAYASLDPRAEPDREAYLSLFTFGRDFVAYLERERSEKGYSGPCGAPWLWWDIDRRDDLPAALSDARGLVGCMLDRYRDFDEDDLLIFLSGGKGLHIGLPVVWSAGPSPTFHAVAKTFGLDLAEQARVAVDGSIYSKTRLFRAPNSRHPSGLFKRRLTHDELMFLAPAAVVERARELAPFDIPSGPPSCPRAADDWLKAARTVERRAMSRPAPGEAPSKLQFLTRDFLTNGADEGERELRCFRAAANLGEFDCPPDLAHALLTEAALDSGLTPSETRRAIDSGLAHARRQREGGAV
jgi:hypothetical protein